MIVTWWPLAVLAVIQLADAALCWKPVGFIRDCLDDVGLPRRFLACAALLKVAAGLGLIVGIWFPPLACFVHRRTRFRRRVDVTSREIYRRKLARPQRRAGELVGVGDIP